VSGRPRSSGPFTGTLVERSSAFLADRLSRRSFINRSAFVGSAVAAGQGVDLLLRPTTAYAAICSCGDPGCGCGTTCCSGFTEFCCTVSGYNWCPSNSVMGGWWKADNSTYCNGPRYYMDCNATCQCDTGCGSGFPFCEPSCDGVSCGCALDTCDRYMTGCLQFRYGQCNQDVACMGRIVCRVVACIPPWEIDPTCTTTNAQDDATAEQDAPCWTPAPPMPPCNSPVTQCEVTAMAATPDGGGYALVTAFGLLFAYGDASNAGSPYPVPLEQPLVGLALRRGGGYWLVGADGGIFAYGGAPYLGSIGGQRLHRPIVALAATPTGDGYWLVAADGGIFAFGDAGYFGSMGGKPLTKPMVALAPTPTGNGYWLVAADGGIFAFGDADYFGSMGGKPLAKAIVGLAATPSGLGYWMVAADGGIFAFGDADYFGSMGGQVLAQPVVELVATPNGLGYWMAAADGGIFAFGDAAYYGSPV